MGEGGPLRIQACLSSGGRKQRPEGRRGPGGGAEGCEEARPPPPVRCVAHTPAHCTLLFGEQSPHQAPTRESHAPSLSACVYAPSLPHPCTYTPPHGVHTGPLSPVPTRPAGPLLPQTLNPYHVCPLHQLDLEGPEATPCPSSLSTPHPPRATCMIFPRSTSLSSRGLQQPPLPLILTPTPSPPPPTHLYDICSLHQPVFECPEAALPDPQALLPCQPTSPQAGGQEGVQVIRGG